MSWVHAYSSHRHEKKPPQKSLGGSHFVPFAQGLQTDRISFFFFALHGRPVKKGKIPSGLRKVTTGMEIRIFNLIGIFVAWSSSF
jgi:hypothetical protein